MTARIIIGLMTLLLTGCGVPVESAPRIIDPDPTPQVSAGVLRPPPSGSATETLYFVKDNLLVAVERPVGTPLDAPQLLNELVTGPNQAEGAQGLTSPLLGTTLIWAVTVNGGTAAVELTEALDTAGRTDDVLAFGQIVCTLGHRNGITSIVFTHDGKRIGVPRGDASVTTDPLTPLAYANLVAS